MRQVTPQPLTSFPPAHAVMATTRPEIRAGNMGCFDPSYQKDQGATNNGPIVNAGKDIYYLDVYVFVDRLRLGSPTRRR